jgi:hypothetical protein
MQQPPANAQFLTFLFPLVAIALVIFRNSRARRLRVETLWIMPLVIIALIGLSFSQQGMPSNLGLGLDAAALVAGALIGWWRGRLTHITVDPQTHQLTSRASPIGMLLILGVFAVRYGLRMYGSEEAAALHMPVNVIADAVLVITVGVVCAQRLEIAIRATRMLTEARANVPG